MNEINHKTVFVLDHSPYFGISAESMLELVATGPPISKSLWTCSVEASVEYCRIVWDLFPNGKLVSLFSVENVTTVRMKNIFVLDSICCE